MIAITTSNSIRVKPENPPLPPLCFLKSPKYQLCFAIPPLFCRFFKEGKCFILTLTILHPHFRHKTWQMLKYTFLFSTPFPYKSLPIYLCRGEGWLARRVHRISLGYARGDGFYKISPHHSFLKRGELK